MINLLFFLSVLGLTSILVDSQIAKPLRDYFKNNIVGDALQCYQCTGFWVSLFIAFILFPPNAHIILYALAGSFIAQLLSVWERYQ